MKRLRIGRRRAHVERSASPLELALAPAVVDGRWHVPDRFNFTRDVVEVLALDPKRRALTFSGESGIIEPLTFRQVAERASRWASVLRARGVKPGDRVLVLVRDGCDWLHVMLGCMKVGAVTVAGSAGASAAALEATLATTGASLVVADHGSDRELAQLSFEPEIQYVDEAPEVEVADGEPTHDTSSRDVAFLFPAAAPDGTSRFVAHTHGAVFAARVQAEHWLDATRGDTVWCTAATGTVQRVWNGLLGPWERGAEIVSYDAPFDPQDRLDLIHRFSATILCQTPSEYRALSEIRMRELQRFRPRQLRRLVSTGGYLDPDVVTVFEQAWGMTIHDGYGQAETNVVVANGADEGYKPGALGLPLPGQHVTVVDDGGDELPPGIEGSLAVRGRTPTLFSGYWELPDQTKTAFTGDWYRTGDVAARDEDGFLWFIGHTDDVISARGRVFGPHEVELALREHRAVREAAVVGVHDLQRGGHFVRAFVVLEPRNAGTEQLEAKLRQHVSDRLPEQQVPREVEFVHALPRSANGKILRDELRQRGVAARPVTAASTGAGIAPELAAAALEPEPVVEPVEPVVEPVVESFAEPVVEHVEPAFEPVSEDVAAAEPASAEPVDTYDPVLAALGGIESVEGPSSQPPDLPTVVEPVAETLVEPVVEPPRVEAVAAPKPTAEPESVEPPVEPVVEHTHEPVVEAGTVEAVPEPVVEPAPEPIAETEPVEAVVGPSVEEAEPGPSVPPASEPLPEYVVERPLEPVAPPPPAPEPEPLAEDGPLPEYIVDPTRPRPVEPEPVPTVHVEPEPAPVAEPAPEDPLAGLGIRPVAEFPRRDAPPDGEKRPRRRRGARDEAAGSEHAKSLGDPGDEPEEVGWMQGLSSRLSAYSLGGEPEEPAEDEPAGDDAPTKPDDGDQST